jgi:hypothetical protein
MAKSRGNLQVFQRLSSVFPAEIRHPNRRYFASLLIEKTAPRQSGLLPLSVLRQLYPSMLTIARTYAVAAAGHTGSVAR